LVEWARTLTSADRNVDVQRRTIQAAEYRFHAGELRRACEMLEAVLREVLAAPKRANALRLLGEIRYNEDSFPEGISLLEQALEHAGSDRAVPSAIEFSLAFGTQVMGDFPTASGHVHRALALAEQLGEPASLAEAFAVAAIADFLVGRGLDQAKVERALRLEDPHHQIPIQMRPSLIAGCLALCMGKLGRCDQLLFGPAGTHR